MDQLRRKRLQLTDQLCCGTDGEKTIAAGDDARNGMDATGKIAAKVAVLRKLGQLLRSLKGEAGRREGLNLVTIFPGPLGHLKHNSSGASVVEHIDLRNPHRFSSFQAAGALTLF